MRSEEGLFRKEGNRMGAAYFMVKSDPERYPFHAKDILRAGIQQLFSDSAL